MYFSNIHSGDCADISGHFAQIDLSFGISSASSNAFEAEEAEGTRSAESCQPFKLLRFLCRVLLSSC